MAQTAQFILKLVLISVSCAISLRLAAAYSYSSSGSSYVSGNYIYVTIIEQFEKEIKIEKIKHDKIDKIKEIKHDKLEKKHDKMEKKHDKMEQKQDKKEKMMEMKHDKLEQMKEKIGEKLAQVEAMKDDKLEKLKELKEAKLDSKMNLMNSKMGKKDSKKLKADASVGMEDESGGDNDKPSMFDMIMGTDDKANREISKRGIEEKLLKKMEKSKVTHKDDNSGYYVATGDYNYAILSPKFEEIGWRSISVNNNEVFVVFLDKKYKTARIKDLDDEGQETLERVSRSFTKNLKKVVLNNPYTPNGLVYPQTARSIGYNQYGSYGKVAGPQKPYGQSSGSQKSYGQSGAPHKSYVQPTTSYKYTPAASSGYSTQFCSHSNYHNLYNSKLNTTLDGDIYYFDTYGNALDIFSTTVSYYCKGSLSVVFRDANYFTYSRPGLPLSINRILLAGKNVIFVYNDGTVLAKPISPSWALDEAELKVVVRARLEVQEIIKQLTHGGKYSPIHMKKYMDKYEHYGPETTTTEKPEKHEKHEKHDKHEKMEKKKDKKMEKVLEKLEKKKEMMEKKMEKKGKKDSKDDDEDDFQLEVEGEFDGEHGDFEAEMEV